MARRSDIAWGEIETDFRLGVISVREIARKHKIAESNLRERAKREGWGRGEGEAVRRAIKDALNSSAESRAREIGAQIGAQQAQAHRMALEEIGLTAAEVVIQHQLAARKAMGVHMALLEQLRLACESRVVTEAELLTCMVDDAARAAAIEKQLGLKGLIDAADRWSNSFSRLQAAERLAHDIGAAGQANEIDELLLRIHQERSASTDTPH